ncbi:hypothetical protein WA026_003802 [Henosepilachna vigintioctopunctata]|uniref:Uncharacterized protein n=1 Tax=Henosepilachna vigintioctopunctata TaxID=420089 RepID=A0AAW1UHY8_9CUCU
MSPLTSICVKWIYGETVLPNGGGDGAASSRQRRPGAPVQFTCTPPFTFRFSTSSEYGRNGTSSVDLRPAMGRRSRPKIKMIQHQENIRDDDVL